MPYPLSVRDNLVLAGGLSPARSSPLSMLAGDAGDVRVAPGHPRRLVPRRPGAVRALRQARVVVAGAGGRPRGAERGRLGNGPAPRRGARVADRDRGAGGWVAVPPPRPGRGARAPRRRLGSPWRWRRRWPRRRRSWSRAASGSSAPGSTRTCRSTCSPPTGSPRGRGEAARPGLPAGPARPGGRGLRGNRSQPRSRLRRADAGDRSDRCAGGAGPARAAGRLAAGLGRAAGRASLPGGLVPDPGGLQGDDGGAVRARPSRSACTSWRGGRWRGPRLDGEPGARGDPARGAGGRGRLLLQLRGALVAARRRRPVGALGARARRAARLPGGAAGARPAGGTRDRRGARRPGDRRCAGGRANDRLRELRDLRPGRPRARQPLQPHLAARGARHLAIRRLSPRPGDGAMPAAGFYLGEALGLAALAYGLAWWLRRGERAVPAALAAAAVLFAYAHFAGTPYQAAKAIVIASPLAMLIAARALLSAEPLIELGGLRGAIARRRGGVAGLLVRRQRRCASAWRWHSWAPPRPPARWRSSTGRSGPASYSPALTELRPALGRGSTLVLAPQQHAGCRARSRLPRLGASRRTGLRGAAGAAPSSRLPPHGASQVITQGFAELAALRRPAPRSARRALRAVAIPAGPERARVLSADLGRRAGRAGREARERQRDTNLARPRNIRLATSRRYARVALIPS